MFRRPKPEVPKEEIFDVDIEHGTLIRKTDGSRVVAFRSVGWATLEKELTSTFITGAAVILQRMGYSYGRYLGRIAKANNKGPAEALQALQEFAAESGLGGLSLNSGDLVSGQARLVLKDCVFCLHIKESSEPICHIYVGLVGGVVDEIIGRSHRVVEDKCIAKGDAVCAVTVERV